MSMVRIVRAIFGDENSVLTASNLLKTKYGQKDVYVGVPCIINREGVQHVLAVSLTDQELEKMNHSCDIIRGFFQKIRL